MPSVINASTSLGLQQTADTSGVLQLQTANTTAVTIDGSQNVGIGTSTLSGKFNVLTATDSKLIFNDGSTTGNVRLEAVNNAYSAYKPLEFNGSTLLFDISGAEKMRIDSSGKVGVGLSVLHSKFSALVDGVGGANNNTVGVSIATDGVGTTQAVSGWRFTGTSFTGIYGGNYAHQWVTDSANALATEIVNTGATPIVFGTSATERARIDSSGNLLVGTTSVGNANNNGISLSVSDGCVRPNHVNGTPTGYAYMQFGYNASTIGSITQNGTTGVLYNLTSDYRLKNEQQPLTGAKEFVMALQPKKWKWWDGSGEGVGFIAHEFMEVAKYSGHGEKDAVDENGNIVAQSIQPSSSEVMANLVAFIQEQQALIEQLRADVETLKGNV